MATVTSTPSVPGRASLHGLANQALLHPLGNVGYWMPPYVINPEEIVQLGRMIAEDIDLATRD